MDMAYCMAMVLMFLKVFRMDGIGSLNLFSSNFIDGMRVVALAHVVITMSGSILQPLVATPPLLNINVLSNCANSHTYKMNNIETSCA
jgi:hypothetical protein